MKCLLASLVCTLIVGSILAQPTYTKDGRRIGPYPCEPGDIVHVRLNEAFAVKFAHAIAQSKVHGGTVTFDLECMEARLLVFQIATAMSDDFTPSKRHREEQRKAAGQ